VIYVEESPKEAKSFTDESSPRKPATSDRKVSIHGQVIRELPLSWFYDLMRLYPGEPGEVKSNRILNNFHNLPGDKKTKIWAGMKQVIVNIVDSLSYQIDYKKILSDVYKHDRAYELLRLHAGQGNEFAKGVLYRMDEAVTEWIIRDSPPHRLKDMMRPRHFPGSLAIYLNRQERRLEKLDLTPFKTKKSSMAGKAVKYAAKSGSVFNRAIDSINPMLMLQNDSWTHYHVRRALRDSHAFDRGDDKSLRWIDSQRKEVVRSGPYGGYDYYDYEDDGFGELYSIPSDSSSYTQAADIAAGFARQDYERHGIAAVAGRFDYVTLNGERITQNNAEAKFEVWRQLIEQEKRNSQQQVIRLN
jgi:hypothetical protein